nr:MAG TPA: hypothetical protein [Caudoviricetes sp.]
MYLATEVSLNKCSAFFKPAGTLLKLPEPL